MRALSIGSALGLVTFAMLAAGCGAGGAASQPAVVFPTKAEIASVPSKKPLAEAFGTNDVRVDDWAFDAAPAGEGAAYDDPSPWGAFLKERVAAHQGAALSPELRCAALEIARFDLKNKGLPAESLRRFMVARCGASAPAIAPLVWSVKAPATVTDEEIVAHAKAKLGAAIDQHLAQAHVVVGLGVARDASDVSVAVVFGREEAKIDAASHVMDANRRVHVHGVVRAGYAEAGALINQGPYGVAHCEADPSAKMPELSFWCPLAPGDAFAWVQILGRKPKMHLETPLANLIVHQGDPRAITYSARHSGPPMPVATGPELARAIFDRVNVVRRAAKLGPFTLAVKQSAENTRLVGTMLDAAVESGDDEASDRAALGLLAGWDVQGATIRGANLFLAGVAPTHDAGAWVDFAIEQPMGRATVLDPDARQIAIGPAIPEGANAVGAVVTAYAMFDKTDHAAETRRFVDRLGKTRLARGLSKPAIVTDFDAMAKNVAFVQASTKTPKEALDDMLQIAAYQTGTAVSGYVLETNDVDRVPIPEELLVGGPLRVAVGITHHKVKGAAWGQYVVFFVILDGGASPVREAREGSSPRAM